MVFQERKLRNERIINKMLKRSSGELYDIGTKVKIHPNLTTDPYNKRGKYGKIIDVNYHGDYTIKFPDGTIGKYANDTVIRKR